MRFEFVDHLLDRLFEDWQRVALIGDDEAVNDQVREDSHENREDRIADEQSDDDFAAVAERGAVADCEAIDWAEDEEPERETARVGGATGEWGRGRRTGV